MSDIGSDEVKEYINLVVSQEDISWEGKLQFVFNDEKSKEPYFLSFDPSQQKLEKIKIDNWDVLIEANMSDILECFFGQESLGKYFSEGKITVLGDFSLAAAFYEGIEKLSTLGFDAEEDDEDAVTDKKYPSTRRESERLAATQSRIKELEKIDGLSVMDFRNKYLAYGRPVVIKGSVDHWKLCQCDWKQLSDLFSASQGFIRKDDYINAAFSNYRNFQTTVISDYIDKLFSDDFSSSSDLPPYLGNNFWPENLTNLFEFPKYFERNEYSPDAPKLWIGPGGTITPLHRDATDNLFVQVLGRKKIILASPDQWEELYTWSRNPGSKLEGCDVDPENPDYDQYPLSSQSHFIEIELNPKDMLFIPEGWFHYVKALEAQISINFWTNTLR